LELQKILKAGVPFKDVSLDEDHLREIFTRKNKEKEAHQFFAESLKKSNMKLKNTAKNAITEPLFPVTSSERHVFQRTLGHPEILGSHKW